MIRSLEILFLKRGHCVIGNLYSIVFNICFHTLKIHAQPNHYFESHQQV